VDVRIEIEKFTASSIQLPVEVIHVPDGYTATLFPEKVQVSFQVALSDFDRVKPYQFRLVADYTSTSHGTAAHHQKMKVNLKRYPSFVSAVSVSPQFVDYILTKK
jgi:YbbR domain-containing protein